MAAPCEVLGVDKTASTEELRSRWRALASEHHPDRGGDAGKFAEMRRAYDAAYKSATEREAWCQVCHGSGFISRSKGFFTTRVPCPECDGIGTV